MASTDDQILNFSEKNLFVSFAKTDNASLKFTTVSNKDYVLEFENQLPHSYRSVSAKPLDDLLMPHIRKRKKTVQDTYSVN